jgi:DNA-binding response OmpR family regulator
MTKQRIAVVNNDRAFLHLMERLLRREGYDTILWTAGDGAYEMLRQERPDLVILDIVMETPEVGWTVLELLRLDPETEAIPVLVCSADSRTLRDKAEQLHQVHTETLEKPFNLDTLLERVATLIGPPAEHGSDTSPRQ